MQRVLAGVLVVFACSSALAETRSVPEDFASIQAAIDASSAGDVILVAPGRYTERLRLRAGVTVRSRGDQAKGALGLKRAEQSILDGGNQEDLAGVVMAAGATLDGFTITNVGRFDQKVWDRHHATQGEELADDEGAIPDTAKEHGPVAGVSIPGVSCRVINNIVYENGFPGIAAVGKAAPTVEGNHCFRNMGGGIAAANGSTATVRGNLCRENLRAGIGCRNAAPLIIDNECSANVRAGIGCREQARPVIRGNKCWGNRRAGIGVRMVGTAPLVVSNMCSRNDMAGIGCRDDASPLIRGNDCLENKLAGIGIDGAHPTVVGNRCRRNQAAGIGLRGGAKALVQDNDCTANKLVAIGVTQGSEAMLQGNRLIREGGAPPLVAILKDSVAQLHDNQLHGGGVAAVLVQGQAVLVGNRFYGEGKKQGNAIWVQPEATAKVIDNQFKGYRSAVFATRPHHVLVIDNVARKTERAAIVIQGSQQPADVRGNRLHTENAETKVLEISGPQGVVADNIATPIPVSPSSK